MSETDVRAAVRFDSEAAQHLLCSLTTGAQPDVVHPQDIPIVVRPRVLSDSVQYVDKTLELARELCEYRTEGLAPGCASDLYRQRVIRAAADGIVLINIHDGLRQTI